METNRELTSLRELEMEKEQRRDLLSFQYKEISDAAIFSGEDDELEVRKKRLRSYEELKRLGGKSYDSLASSINDSLAEIRSDLSQMALYDQSLLELSEGLADNSFQLEELTHSLRNYLDTMSDDPEELDEVTARIDLLQSLKRKYAGLIS